MKIETRYTVDGSVTPIIGDPQFQKLDEEKVQLLLQRIARLEQDLLRTEHEKGQVYREMESMRRENHLVRTERQRLLNERGQLRQRAMRVWVRIGKWLGIPQDGSDGSSQ
jgi:hypothetical protein